MSDQRASVEATIRAAFPTIPPPPASQLLPNDLNDWRPFEASELLKLLAGRPWDALSKQDIDEHSDWLVYLTTTAFVYYLPAWLIYSLRYGEADYAALWTVHYLSENEAAGRSCLTIEQQIAVLKFYRYLHAAYPDESIPPAPTFIGAEHNGSPVLDYTPASPGL